MPCGNCFYCVKVLLSIYLRIWSCLCFCHVYFCVNDYFHDVWMWSFMFVWDKGQEDLCEAFFAYNRAKGTLYDGETRLFLRNSGIHLSNFNLFFLVFLKCIYPFERSLISILFFHGKWLFHLDGRSGSSKYPVPFFSYFLEHTVFFENERSFYPWGNKMEP